MDEKELKKLHALLLKTALEIDRVCRENKIKYSLIGGSLIGAVRHSGFIPWDDDMDIGMLREDYDRFIAVCATGLGKEYDLQTNQSDHNFNYGYAKVLLRGTYLVEAGHENTKYRKGIFVDVFPFDAVPDERGDRERQKRKNYILQKLLRQKSRVKDDPGWRISKRITARILDLVCLLVSRDRLIAMLNDNLTRYAQTATQKIANMSGMYGYDRESVDRSIFDAVHKTMFEDTELRIIDKYDRYLSHIYGDYMRLPPENKRTAHEFQTLDFGKYR